MRVPYARHEDENPCGVVRASEGTTPECQCSSGCARRRLSGEPRQRCAAGRAGSGATVTAVRAQTRSVTWDSIDVTVELRDDGSFHVTERDRIDFSGGPFRSGFRVIPRARIDGFENVQVGEVVGESVEPYRYVSPRAFSKDVPNTYTFETVGSELRIDWSFPPTTSRARTFEATFDATGALRVYADNDPPYHRFPGLGSTGRLPKTLPSTKRP